MALLPKLVISHFFINNLTNRLVTNFKIRDFTSYSRPCRSYSLNYEDYQKYYDVIIVGGGHAGTEACAASARMGAKTLLVTHKKSMIGAMSCNPSFGGIGKGHLMIEVDALDGLCSRICDRSGIHYKILNKSKGPAVWGYRAQIDRSFYKQELQKELFGISNLDIIEASVEDLILKEMTFCDKEKEAPHCTGVLLDTGEEIFGNCVVLTTGTFLRGLINIGLDVKPAGRLGDEPAIGLAKTLERLDFKISRLKTGTPPRLDKNTIDFSRCIVFRPDDPPRPFSFMSEKVWIKPEDQLNCYMTFTTESVEKIVKETLHLNRHVREEVSGPRYCPSIESKVLRYPGRIHQVWLEPEGLTSSVIYPQGISCTMPPEKQQELVRLMQGLEVAEIIQPGYGVEYDFVNPQELTPQLETKRIPNLYFAGQINGTTGYEEAAAQGIVAGINAAARSQKRLGLTLDRTDSYIGVLIDDLTTLGTSEPYRMFTSRAEFRLSLRPDNADLRLTTKGYEVGCVSEERYRKVVDISSKLNYWINVMKKDQRKQKEWELILPEYEKSKNKGLEKSAFKILEILPLDTRMDGFMGETSPFAPLKEEQSLLHRLRIEAHYTYPMTQDKELMKTVRMNQAMALPRSLDYYCPQLSLSNEMRKKLSEIRPTTIAAASCIPGVTPAAITNLLRYVKLKRRSNHQVFTVE